MATSLNVNFDNLPYPRAESHSRSGPKIIFMALLLVVTLRTSRTNSCLSIAKKTLAWIRGQILATVFASDR